LYPTCVSEIIEIGRDIVSKKSAGYDGVLAEMLKCHYHI